MKFVKFFSSSLESVVYSYIHLGIRLDKTPLRVDRRMISDRRARTRSLHMISATSLSFDTRTHKARLLHSATYAAVVFDKQGWHDGKYRAGAHGVSV